MPVFARRITTGKRRPAARLKPPRLPGRRRLDRDLEKRMSESVKVTEDAVFAALSHVQEPELHRDLVTLNMIQDLKIKGEQVSFSLVLTTPACPLRGRIENEARQAVAAIPGVRSVEIQMAANVPSDGRARGLLELPIRNAVAIASGKGGVGKRTVAVNVAGVLAPRGARGGLL